MVPRADRASVARLEEDAREIEHRAGSQGSLREARQILEGGSGVNEASRSPSGFGFSKVTTRGPGPSRGPLRLRDSRRREGSASTG